MYSEGSTHRKGDRAVTETLAVLVRAGLSVLLPFGVEHRYDLVVDHDGVFVRIQCKSARLGTNGTLRFNTSSTSYGKRRRGSHGEADFFAVFFDVTDKVYFFPVQGTGTDKQLRIVPSRNGQCKGVKLASDYESDKMIPKIFAHVAQQVEHSLDKGEVVSSTLTVGTK
jgi:hypothetical protein